MGIRQLNTMRKAVFLDKDGTLIPDIPYNCDPEKITLQPKCVDGLRLLHEIGYQLIVVSNQAGIAHGFFTEGQFVLVLNQLQKILLDADLPIAGFYYCPHHPQAKLAEYREVCDCRKPSPGLLLRAARQHHIDLSKSWMIGDILNDVEAGNRAGCRSILIDNGNETEWLPGKFRKPVFCGMHINDAAIYIYNQQLIND
jgi:D,D-heptose 1,7-bisphosphate phosphatase